MKKKALTTIILLAITLSLLACGADKDTNSKADTTDVKELQKQVEDLQKQVEDLQEENEKLKAKASDNNGDIMDIINDVADTTDADDPSTWSDDMVITFTDPEFAECVRQTIGMPEGNITYGMIKDITALDFDSKPDGDRSDWYMPKDIQSLKYFRNLNKLNINLGSCDTDISSLGKLTNLTHLTIWHCNNLENLSPIEGLTKITLLKLEFCDNLTDISGIDTMQNITDLSISYCDKLVDISEIKHLSALERLYIYEIGTPLNYDSYMNSDGEIQEFLNSL